MTLGPAPEGPPAEAVAPPPPSHVMCSHSSGCAGQRWVLRGLFDDPFSRGVVPEAWTRQAESTEMSTPTTPGPAPEGMSAITAKRASNAAAGQACRLLELPEELLRRVLEYLCPASLQFAGSTCGQLRRATAAPGLAEAVVRGSDEFWAPLAYDYYPRMIMGHLLPRPNPDVASTLGGLRRYFSGMRLADYPMGNDDLFLYCTLERGGEIVATCGPEDAGDASTFLYYLGTSSTEPSYWGITMLLKWKSISERGEYTKLVGGVPQLKKAVTVTCYSLTRDGAYVISRVSVKEGSKGPTSRDGVDIEPNLVGGSYAVDLLIPITNYSYGRWYRNFMPEAPKRHDIHLQVVDHFRPTCREVISVV